MRRRTLWLLIGTLPITLPVGYMVIGTIILSLFGYYPDAIGWQVAEQLAKAGGKGEDCMKIVHLIPHILSPTQGEQRGTCIHEFASLTKDPTACRYLMPSEYGRSCIGAALDAADLDKCNLMGDKSVRWLDNGNLKEVTLQSCEKEKQTTVMARNCCYISRLTFSDAINDCSGIQDNPQLLDECYYQLANKKHETAQCASIQNSKMRSACELLLGNSQK